MPIDREIHHYYNGFYNDNLIFETAYFPFNILVCDDSDGNFRVNYLALKGEAFLRKNGKYLFHYRSRNCYQRSNWFDSKRG